MTSEKHAQANRAKAEARRATTAQFIEKAQVVHGNKFDYAKTEYAGSLNKVTITCPVHGDFEQKANAHTNGQGCPKCGKLAMATKLSSSNRMTTAQFIEDAQAVHGDKYDYSRVVYVGSLSKVTITCREHGDFEQAASEHLRGRGCSACATEGSRMTTAQFIEKAQAVHGDKFDYSKTVYTFNKRKVTITCPTHGDFEQEASSHLRGRGCPKCGILTSVQAATTANTMTHEHFIEKARTVHGDKYSYGKLVYTGALDKVIITCPEHGDFEQIASNHIRGAGCVMCARRSHSVYKLSSTHEFTEKARDVHGDKYGYTKTVYLRSNLKVIITCPEHGDFEQEASSHLRGCGCPACAKVVSQPELDIKAIIESCGYEAQHRYRPAFLKGKELDLFVPALNLAIEYCGSHVHNVDRNFLGGEPKSKTYHYDKWKACRDNGITLLTVFDFQWLTKREKVEALLRHKLQRADRRVYARKCSIVELDRATCWDFVKKNHIEGTGVWKLNCTYKGLKLGDELVAVMVEQEGDIKRSCTLRGVAVIGGVSRLFKAFPAGTTMMTTNDTGSTGDYGTRLAKHTLRYWWVNPKTSEALTRNTCMKHKLEARFGIPVDDKTEVTYMQSLGWVRVFDSGLSYFVNR